MDPDTRFSEEEVQKILARAARQQDRSESAKDASSTGLSLTRLQEVAADVGIAPSIVEAAAREELLRREGAAQATVLGLPRELGTVRSGPAGVTDAQWEQMVSEFRRIFRKSGIPSQFGEVREWVSTNEAEESMPVTIRLEPDPSGGTRIRVHQPVGIVSSLIWGIGGGVTGVGVLFAMFHLFGLLDPDALLFAMFMMALGLLCSGVGWVSGRAWSGQQQRALERAADRAELILRS